MHPTQTDMYFNVVIMLKKEQKAADEFHSSSSTSWIFSLVFGLVNPHNAHGQTCMP